MKLGKNIYCLALIALISLGCKQEVDAWYEPLIDTRGYPKIIQNTQLPILACYGIEEGHLSKEKFEELRRAGFNYNLSFFTSIDSLKKCLILAEETGVKVIAYCPELHINARHTVPQIMQYSSLAGYFIRDEPFLSDLNDMISLVNQIKSIDSTKIYYYNLYPYGGGVLKEDYSDYVSAFAQAMPTEFISFDNYPIVGNKLKEDWYENLEIVEEIAATKQKDFWAYVLSTSFASHEVPDLAQLRLQVYSNLAYGAKGIQYFTYWTPVSNIYNYSNGPIATNGKINPVYYVVQQMNEELRILSDIFMESKTKNIFHTNPAGGTTQFNKSHYPDYIKEFNVTSACLISFLQSKNSEFMLVVNKDFKKKVKMKLTFNEAQKAYRIVKDGSLLPVGLYNGEMIIQPGDICIIQINRF